jgi:hypothetical protein
MAESLSQWNGIWYCILYSRLRCLGGRQHLNCVGSLTLSGAFHLGPGCKRPAGTHGCRPELFTRWGMGGFPVWGQVAARFIVRSDGPDRKVCLVPKNVRGSPFRPVCMNLPQRRPWICTVVGRLEPSGAEIVYTACSALVTLFPAPRRQITCPSNSY